MENRLYQNLHTNSLSDLFHWDKRFNLFQNKRIHAHFLTNFYKNNFYILLYICNESRPFLKERVLEEKELLEHLTPVMTDENFKIRQKNEC